MRDARGWKELELTGAARQEAGGSANVGIYFGRDDRPRLMGSVLDDGRGKPPCGGPAHALGGHYGLAIMRERARRIGARLRIHGRSGKGTRVRLDVPCSPGGTP